MHDPDEKLTDLQYGLMCGLSPERLAARTCTTPTSVRRELADAPVPPWVADLGLTRPDGP